MEFQLSELFAYPNTEISGAGQRVRIIEVGLYGQKHSKLKLASSIMSHL